MEPTSRVGLDAPSKALMLGGSALVGGALAFVVPAVTSWAEDQSWLPAQDLLPQLSDAATAAPLVVRLLVLLLLGLVVGGWLCHQARTLEITDSELWVVEGGKRTRWSRRQIETVALAGRRMSLRDDKDAELDEVSLDSPPDEVRRALKDHGWPLVG